ncbi:unnamed protein product [Heterobilharzia americana]|nr:unnamed protein product [Heterobilharzia americana]
MATVLSQVDYCTFIICFDDPDSEIKHRENIQEIHVHELISYLDFHRHPINPGDFVLLPQSAAHSDHFSHSSDKYYLIPFQVGKVLSGCELRSSIRKGSTSFDTPLKVEFMRQNHDETVPTGSFKIPLNTALWIPHDLAVTKLLSNKTQWKITPSNGESHTVCVSTCSTPPIDAASAQAVLPKQLETLNTTPGLVAVNSNNTQVHHTEEIKTNKNLSRPFSHLAPFSIGGFANNDDAKGGNALNYAYTKDELDRMKNEFIDSDYASSMDEVASGSNLQKKKISKSESNILSEALYEFHSDTAHQFVERKSCESEHVYRLTNDEAHRICNQMKDVTTYVDPELQYGKLNIKWVKGQSKQLSSRPEWRYWGAKPIPQLIGPPIFEPFKDATSWGRSDRLPTTVNISRPEIRFTKFSNTPEPVDHCDSRNVQLCLRDSSVSNKNILKRRYTRNKT